MKNFGVERRASRESRQDPAASGTSSNGSPTEGGKKLRFSKLWVCTRRSNLPISKIGKSAPRRASDVLRGLEGIEKNGRVLSDEKSSQTYVDYSSTTDASTETIDAQFKKAFADAAVSCRCETVSASSGPDEFVEIRCVNRSTSAAVQTEACAESARSATGSSTRDKRRCSSILSGGSSEARPEELLEAAEDIEAGLIYDGMTRCFPYPIEVTVKPKYVATCESCESSTDKRVSISHGGLDAAVGSSIIIIDAGLERASLDESYQRSVSCQVCDDCVELEEATRSRAWQSVARDRSGTKNRQRGWRDTSVDDESVRNSDISDGGFEETSSVATHDDTGGSADRRGSRSVGRHRRSSSGERRSGRSRMYGEEDSRLRDESSKFWEKSLSNGLNDRQQLDDSGGWRSVRSHGRTSSDDTRSRRSRVYGEQDSQKESSMFWKESTSSRLDDREQHDDTGGSRSARRHARTYSGDRRPGRSRIYDGEHSQLSDKSSKFFKDSVSSWLDDRQQHDTDISRSARGHEISSSGEKRLGRSRIHEEEPGRLPDESSTFWKENTSDWLDDHDRRRSALVPLHESSRLSLRTVEKTGKNLRPPGQRLINSTVDAKLLETSTRNKKPYSLPGCEMNSRTEDFEDIVPRKRKSRTSDTPENRAPGGAAITRFRALDQKEPLFRCGRDQPFVFEIRKFTKPALVTNELRQLVSKNCKISEFNNFGKWYEWDRSLDPLDRQNVANAETAVVDQKPENGAAATSREANDVANYRFWGLKREKSMDPCRGSKLFGTKCFTITTSFRK